MTRYPCAPQKLRLPYVFGYAVAGGDHLTANLSSAEPCQFLDAHRDYSGGGWGELNCVQTPAGGIVSYAYKLDGGGMRQNFGLTLNPVVGKTVQQSVPNTTSDLWTYSYSEWNTALACGNQGQTRCFRPFHNSSPIEPLRFCHRRVGNIRKIRI